jgi:hypothetical protein
VHREPQRIRDARFPELKTLGEFDFNTAEGIEAAQIDELAVAAGSTRRKSYPCRADRHGEIALGLEAARQRRRVAFFRAADPVRMLVDRPSSSVDRLHAPLRLIYRQAAITVRNRC